VPCCALLCLAVPCCALLCLAVPCCALLCLAVPCCAGIYNVHQSGVCAARWIEHVQQDAWLLDVHIVLKNVT
jgi:hypothetical protein